MPILTHKDANIYYETVGSGQPLILISGYAADHQAWMLMTERLSQQFQVITFDNRGVGRTKDSGAPLSIDIMANDVLVLMEELKLNKPCVLGHSMGGNIAQRVAVLAPDKIQELILLTTSAKWRLAMLHAFRTTLAMRESGMSFDWIFDSALPWLAGNKFLSNPNNAAQLKKAMLENPYPQSLEDQRRQFNALLQYNGENYLENITARTLVIYGVEDIITLPYESEHLVHYIEKATLHGLPCAHIANFEVPQDVCDSIEKFVAYEL